MAAHTLTIIKQMLERAIDDKACEQLEYALSYARGMDVPFIATRYTDDGILDDWSILNEAVKKRDCDAVAAHLHDMLPRYAYMKHYRMFEHLYDVYSKYVYGVGLGEAEADARSEARKRFFSLSCEEHEQLAAASGYAKCNARAALIADFESHK